MLGGGVGRREGPKKSALRDRAGTVCCTLGVSSALTSDLSDPSDRSDLSDPDRTWGGFGGGFVNELSSAKGDAKNAYVLLAGDGGGCGAEGSSWNGDAKNA